MPEPAVVYFQGDFCPDQEARVSIRSKILNYGLGVFEGVRAYWGEDEQLYIFRCQDHYRRLLDSCRICRLTLDKTVDELTEITVELCRLNAFRQDTYIRPIVYVGDETMSPIVPEGAGDFAIWCMLLDDYLPGDGVTAVVSAWQRVSDNMIPPRAKPVAAYLNSALARADARKAGADEAIFLTSQGYVAEGSAEHVFLVRDGKLFTPPTEDDNLDGITKRTIREIVPKHLGYEVEVRHVRRSELYIADELFFVGTGAQVTPVLNVDFRAVGDGKPGPITSEVRRLYHQVVHSRVPEYAAWCTPVYA